ncbi:helix-turn-helix transcriptional regulator [Listeria booriae]|uniref:helix-turn-helix domain-containing protein n=1 Tax=Listeria booriae TaxID=1552123 RepID=UPI0016264970|nr:helix-turn-helix transcriptional regulator [Listeria booriae]MBC1286902.1 helix-turn-helix transcriptional regulator [Listeria booriae]
MLINRLAVLIAERRLNISKLSEETGISRPTLTQISKNENKMIQLETINQLCMYLEISPDDFFSYLPYEFEFDFLSSDLVIDFVGTKTYIDVESFNFDFTFELVIKVVYKDGYIPINVSGSLGISKHFEKRLVITLKVENENSDAWQKYISDLSVDFRHIFDDSVIKFLKLNLFDAIEDKLEHECNILTNDYTDSIFETIDSYDTDLKCSW